YVWFRSLIGLALIFFLLGLLFNREADFYWERLKRIVRSPLFIAVSVFVTAFLAATFFGVDPAFSFWSNFERGEGGLQILNLYVFFVLLFWYTGRTAIFLRRHVRDKFCTTHHALFHLFRRGLFPVFLVILARTFPDT
ncbi:hypothetical protein LCGC14_2546990, partial [marine sediment metagenome]